MAERVEASVCSEFESAERLYSEAYESILSLAHSGSTLGAADRIKKYLTEHGMDRSLSVRETYASKCGWLHFGIIKCTGSS